MILVDSNVLIATSAVTHIHHIPSRAFLFSYAPVDLAVTAASLCEVYNNLTRPPPRFNFPPIVAQAQVDDIAQRLRVVALEPTAVIATIRRFALLGGTGPRLYDYLIGATGEAFGADTIVTWNVRHFDRLFSHLRIITPAELTA